MSRKAVAKPDALPDLDDLLQCPVCYEMPSGQIFQCNEGHHVCGRCKVRLDVCPVCRALFFGTRNYAMEELIANVRKLRAFKLGGKITTGSGSSESSTPVREIVSDDPDNSTGDDEEEDLQLSNQSSSRPPQACKGLFRCLCCKNGNTERLPAARLLNHLRYFHSPELIEGRSENGEYIQAWQITTDPGRITTAVRVSDMGIFFLIIDISYNSVCAWLRMAASPWVAHEFCYTLTISGIDREAIFTDCVWSVRSCEGSLKKRGHCLSVEGLDAHALIAPASISGKLSIRRSPSDQVTQQTQPRAVLRIASRGTALDARDAHTPGRIELRPFLQEIQNDVVRLTLAFATLGREADALVRSEAEIIARIENDQNRQNVDPVNDHRSTTAEVDSETTSDNQRDDNERRQMSRSARRRMRQRLRAALNETQLQQPPQVPTRQVNIRDAATQHSPVHDNQVMLMTGLTVVQQNPVSSSTVNQQITSDPSNGIEENSHNVRVNKRNRRHRR